MKHTDRYYTVIQPYVIQHNDRECNTGHCPDIPQLAEQNTMIGDMRQLFLTRSEYQYTISHQNTVSQ